MAESPGKPLAGIRVVDFSRLLPGAYCTWILATLGADVIKIEQPGRGDYQRDIGLQVGARGAAVFQLVNQGKRSLGLDLKNPTSRPILDRLLGTADVIIESFRPGVAARLGIDFEALRSARPALVCLSINGFGSNSPMRNTAAHDINYLALSGLTNRQLQAGEGVPDVPLVDLIGGGLIPALSVLSMLFRAKLTGIGGIADASLADGVPMLPCEALATAMLGLPETPKEEAAHAGSAPNYTFYALRDGYVTVGAVEEEFWREFCRRMDISPLPTTAPREQLLAVKEDLTTRFRAMSRREVEMKFAGADVCVTVVRTYAEMLASEQAKVRSYVGSRPEADAMPRLGSPFFHDGSRVFADGTAPVLGEHSAQLLHELGFSSTQIDAFLASGAVQSASPTGVSREVDQ